MGQGAIKVDVHEHIELPFFFLSMLYKETSPCGSLGLDLIPHDSFTDCEAVPA